MEFRDQIIYEDKIRIIIEHYIVQHHSEQKQRKNFATKVQF